MKYEEFLKAVRTFCYVFIVCLTCFAIGTVTKGFIFRREALKNGVAHYDPLTGEFVLSPPPIPQVPSSALFDKAIEPPKAVLNKTNAKKNFKKTNAASIRTKSKA